MKQRQSQRASLVIAAALVLFFCVSVFGDDRKDAPLPIEAVLTRRSFCEMFPMQLSPDGMRLAYVVRTRRSAQPPEIDRFAQTGVPWNGFGCDVFVKDLRVGKTFDVTGGIGSNWLPQWSPDGRYLAFLSDRMRPDQAALWAWDSRADILQMVSSARIRMVSWEHPQWTPDSRSVVVTTAPQTAESDAPAETGLRLSGGKPPGLTVSVYRSSGPGEDAKRALNAGIVGMDWTLQNLVLLNLESGAGTVLLRGRRIHSFLVSPDGSRIICASPKQFASPASLEIEDDLLSIPLNAGKVSVVATRIRLMLTGTFSISPGGHFVAYYGHEGAGAKLHIISLEGVGRPTATALDGPAMAHARDTTVPLWSLDERHIYLAHNGSLWKVDSDGVQAKRIGGVPGRTIISLVSQGPGVLALGPDGRSAMVETYDDEEKRDGFYALDFNSGGSRKLHEMDEGYEFVNAFEGQGVESAGSPGRIAYIAENAQTPPDIWTADAAFERVERTTDINPALSAYRMGAMRGISWLDDDGQKLDGGLLLPTGYQSEQRYPLIVFVYGGSFLSNFRNQFGGTSIPYDNIQWFATRGYAVLLPDAPQHEGTPMLDLAKTVLGGVNKAIELGIADPDRVGVFGTSYGGYSVLSLLVETNRFKAAVETSGMADLTGTYGQMKYDGSAFGLLAEHGQLLMGGTPWEYRDRYIENSPLFYLDRVKTPLLILHGEKDTGVGVFLADQLFVSLRRLGAEVEYRRYAEEGHVFYGLANQEDAAIRIIDWFDRHLKPALGL